MNAIVVVFDPCGVLYLQFRDTEATRTVELIEDELLVDLDEHDNVLGIEVLRPESLSSALRQIPEAYHLPEEAQLVSFENLDKAFVWDVAIEPLPEPSEGQPIEYGGLPGAEALILIPIGMIIALLIRFLFFMADKPPLHFPS